MVSSFFFLNAMAALQYLESLRNSHPELSDWYNSLADLYQKKLWHQLTLKLEQFVALAVFQVQLFFPYHSQLLLLFYNYYYWLRVCFVLFQRLLGLGFCFFCGGQWSCSLE